MNLGDRAENNAGRIRRTSLGLEGFDRIALADDPAFLDPALETRAIVQWQIDRQAEKFLEVLSREIKSPSKEDGVADPEALSDEVI